MLKNGKHPPREHRGVSKINNNLILASMATVGVATGVTINQVTTLAATDDTVVEPVNTQQNDTVEPENTDEQPVKEDNTEDHDTSGNLSDYYEDAQGQVDDANKKADEANNSLSKLQALLNDSTLTSQDNWQDNLQKALEEYKNNAVKFNETTDETQRLINLYQEKINNTIKNPPNAVQQVTDTETTGTELEDYQQLTDAFEKNINEQLQIVQNNLKNYEASDLVNQTSNNLTKAADELNSGINDSTKTSADIVRLKADYDEAVKVYNDAVLAYNDQSGEQMATIDNVPDVDEILSDLKIKEAYDTANSKYGEVQGKISEYNTAVEKWKDAVDKYNSALDSQSDDEALKTAQQEVSDAIDSLKDNQNNYINVFSNPDNQKVISDYVNVSKNNPDEYSELNRRQSDYLNKQQSLDDFQYRLQNAKDEGKSEAIIALAEKEVADAEERLNKARDNFNAAKEVVDNIVNPLKQKYDEISEKRKAAVQSYNDSLSDFQDKLTSWQTAYDNYIKNSDGQLSDLEKAVTTSQDELKNTIEVINNSQVEYKKALDNYQKVLNENKSNETAVSDELTDLSKLQTDLINELNQNNDLIAESLLQQRITKINNIILAINRDQDTLKEIYNVFDQVRDRETLVDTLQKVSDSLSLKVDDYLVAINGNDDTLSYADLVTNFKKFKTDSISAPYLEVDDVIKQYDEFNTELTEFKENLNTFLDSQIKIDNSSAIESMKDDTKLSTTGQSFSLDEDDGNTATLHMKKKFGGKLEDFIDNTGIESNSAASILIGNADRIIRQNSKNTGSYAEITTEKRNEIKEMLDNELIPIFERKGIQYHLMGIAISTTKDGVEIESLNDIYIFTSLDPSQEVMDMFTGTSANSNENSSFDILYTKSPQIGEQDTIDLINDETLPNLETISNVDLDSSSLTSEGVEVVIPEPNEQESVGSATEYHGGETIENAFNALDIKQAPKITLNNIKETSGSIDDSGTTNPDTPDPEDPENPDIPDITDPENPDTSDPETPNTNDTDNPEITDSDELNPNDDVNIPSNNNGTVSYEIVYDPQSGRIYDSTTKVSINHQNDSIEKLPQMGQENKGIWALLGSLLLAISSFSFIDLKKKD